MLEMMKRLFKDEEGQGLVEYGLILALIALVVVTALSPLGDKVKGIFDSVGNKLDEEVP